MAISTYSELQTAISDWMERTDVTGNVADVISLAEARLNRLLDTVEADATLTGVSGSRSISISAYNIVRPIALFLNDNDQEFEIVPRPDGSFPYTDISGFPSFWGIDGSNIDFNCPLDEAYAFRFRYVGRFALSDSAPTNDLLTKNPDIYLAACIVWGGLYVVDDTTVARYEGRLNEYIKEQKRVEESARRSRSTVDPALSSIGRRFCYWGTTW